MSECDASANVRANISKDTPLQIRYAIAGAPNCYSATAIVDGKQVRGYVLHSDMDAILEFDRARIKVTRETFDAPRAIPQPSAQTTDPGVSGKKEAEVEKAADAKKPAGAQEPVIETPKPETPKPASPANQPQ
ncbi:MAG: hypothetical protein ABI833_12940 [Acidobacteriota bacterium]